MNPMTGPSPLSAYLNDKRALIATVIIAASFLPFIGAGNSTASLIDIQSQVNVAKQGLRLVGGFLGPDGPGSSSSDGVAGGLNLLLTLYLVPATAAIVILLALTSRGTRLSGVVNGILAVTLPIAVPMIAGVLFLSTLPKELRALLAQRGGGPDFTSFGIGVWVITALGVAQLGFSFRRDASTAPLAQSNKRLST